MTGYLSKNEIFATGFKTAEIEIVGGKVLVRELSTAEVEQLGFAMLTDGKVDPNRAKGRMQQIFVWCTLDQDKKQLFKQGDITRVAKLGWDLVYNIAIKAMELTGLSEPEEVEVPNP